VRLVLSCNTATWKQLERLGASLFENRYFQPAQGESALLLDLFTPAEFAAYQAEDPAVLPDTTHPPGFFGKRAAFARDGQYGRWLLGLPVAIIINDTLFMHGGPSAVLAGLSIEEINQRYRTALSNVVSMPDAGRLDAAHANPLLSDDGPNWYRGAALCNEASETDVLKPLMEGLGVKRVVIGHTITRNLRVVSRFPPAAVTSNVNQPAKRRPWPAP